MMIYKAKILIKILFIYLFYLPGLILHEGSHALAALMTLSSIKEIKLFPNIQFEDNGAYRVTYGYVSSAVRFKASFMLIGIAPLFLWLIPANIVLTEGWISIDTMKIYWDTILRMRNLPFIYLFLQIFWAGFPSSQDWKVFFVGLFSVSGLVLILMGSMTYFWVS